jgi:uncharacterized membrane protein
LASRVEAITKAVTYRIWQSANTFAIAWLFTGRYETAAQIVGAEVLVKIAVFYLHERIWNKLGKENGLPKLVRRKLR